MTGYIDLGDSKENERIEMVGQTVVVTGKVAGFLVETMEKADRYITKLQQQFPGIQILSKGTPPLFRGMVLVKVGPPVMQKGARA